jgi:F-type H+-transporting ATPase subunit alpha
MELLKQPLYHPLSLHEQVITLCAATHKIFMDVEVKQIKEFQEDMLRYFEQIHPEIVKEIEEKKELPETLIQAIVKAAEEYKADRGR